MNRIQEVRFFGGKFKRNDFVIVKVSGKDAFTFFQGQTTNDILGLKDKEFQFNARIDRNGKIVGYFILAKRDQELFLFNPIDHGDDLLINLEKFVIMEDVSFSEKSPCEIQFYLEPNYNELSKKNDMFHGKILGEEAFLCWEDLEFYKNSQLKPISEEILSDFFIISADPFFDRKKLIGKLINETILNDLAVSYSKGCFLGQETISKINNNRKGNIFPTLIEFEGKLKKDIFSDEELIGQLELESKTYVLANLKRDFREVGKQFKFNDHEGLIVKVPLFQKNKAMELYYLAIEEFHKGYDDLALSYLKRVIEIDPMYSDAYESIGVILGRLKKFEDAILYMDLLLEIDSDSIMAHTNKSLFLMNLGKIDEAEKEKELATLLGFKKNQKDFQEKKNQKEEENKEMKRISMFEEVLKIDSDDLMANLGLAEIYYNQGKAEKSLKYIKKLLEINPNHAKGKSLEQKVFEKLKL